MSKHDDERERERSARKKAEIEAVVNANKEIVYNYIAAHKDVSAKQCVEDLQLFEKGKRYLEWLTFYGHLVRMKRQVGGKRMYVYNAVTPYVKPVVEILDGTKPTESTDDRTAIERATRVINLMDRPQIPKTKEEREKLRRSSKSVAIGSSMTMFGSW
jgi:deoxyribodipyrimidine photolyase